MAATNPQTLIEEVKCYACYGASVVQLLRLALLRRSVLAVAPETDVSPEGLISYGKCFLCNGTVDVPALLELSLLDILQANL